MRFTANSFRNSAFSEPFLKRYRKQKLNFLSATHWLDDVGDYSGTQRNKYVLESDGTAVINSSHITSQTVTSKKGTATATVTTGQIAISSGWISEIVLSDGTKYFLEESIGTIIFDVSAGRNDATLTGVATWAIKRDITLTNNANNFGYSVGQSLVPLASSKFATNGIAYWYLNRSTSAYNSVEKSMTITSNDTERFGVFLNLFLVSGRNYSVKFKAKTTNFFTNFGSIGGNATIGTVVSNPNLSAVFQDYEFNITANQTTFRIYTQINPAIGSNFTITDIVIIDKSTGILSRLESDITKDVLGNNLQFVGRVASDMTFTESNCIEINNTTDFGQLDFDLTGITIVSFEGTATPSIDETNNRILFSDGVGTFYKCELSNGLKYIIAEGLNVTSYSENDQTKQIIWNGGTTWTTQNDYHFNITNGFNKGINLVKYSQDFTVGIYWGIVKASISTGFTSPFSDSLAQKLKTNTETGEHSVRTPSNISVTALLEYTTSVYFKASEKTFGFINFGTEGFSAVTNSFFNLTTGVATAGTGCIVSMEDVGNDWFRCSATKTATATTALHNARIGLCDDNLSSVTTGGNTTDGLLIYGFQFNLKTINDNYQRTDFSITDGVKLPYLVGGVYSNAATNGHNQAETKLKQVVFREDFGESSLHFDQSDLSSEVITYADIANTANVFVNQFPNVKINLETFFPSGIVNQSNRQNNGLRRNKDTFFGNNK
jgi:hypothetical protein